MPALRDIKVVLEMAAEGARKQFEREKAHADKVYPGHHAYCGGWNSLSVGQKDWRCEAQLDYLLEPPCAEIVRYLLVAKGGDPTGGAIFTRTMRIEHGRHVRDWVVSDFNGLDFVLLSDSKVTDPAEALTQALLELP